MKIDLKEKYAMMLILIIVFTIGIFVLAGYNFYFTHISENGFFLVGWIPAIFIITYMLEVVAVLRYKVGKEKKALKILFISILNYAIQSVILGLSLFFYVG